MFYQKSDTPYIFFDIDGVLNKESDWHVHHFSINDECFNVFKKIIDSLTDIYKTEPKLITCSTWRAGFNNRNENGNTSSLLETKFKENGLTIDGATPISNKTRQAEIEYYMRRNNVTSYIVIDDDESLDDRPSEINLYVPDYKKGLVKQDINKIIWQLSKTERK